MSTMKYHKPIVIAIVMVLFTINIHAQNNRRDRIKALKVAFITERLALTSEEAQKFWPIYNVHDDRIFELRKVELSRIKKEIRYSNFDSITEEKAVDILDRISEIEKLIFEEEQKLIRGLSKIISAKKIILLKKAEDDFNRELLKRLRERRSQQPFRKRN